MRYSAFSTTTQIRTRTSSKKNDEIQRTNRIPKKNVCRNVSNAVKNGFFKDVTFELDTAFHIIQGTSFALSAAVGYIEG